MLKLSKLVVSLVVAFSLFWTTFQPVNAASTPQFQSSGGSKFPVLEMCTDCRLEENGRAGLTGTVLTVQETSLYLVPILEDFSVDSQAETLKVRVSPGMSFEIAQTYKLVDDKSNASSYGLLANTYGGKFLGVLLLASNSVLTTVDYVKKNVRLSPVVTYIAGANDIYPNKVENILLALEHLSAYQDRHQGFKADKYISVLRAFGFYSYQAFQEYKIGALASGTSAPAGGVCAAATGLASLALLTEGAKTIGIVHHDKEHLYFQGPFSPPAEKVDSGISIRADGGFEELGFTLPNSGYFRVDVQLLANGVSYQKTDPKGLQGLSDTVLLISISFNQEPMPDQTNTLKDLVASFQQFRESAHESPLVGEMEWLPEGILTEGVMLSNIQKLYTAPD
jgi:hypothetical protein